MNTNVFSSIALQILCILVLISIKTRRKSHSNATRKYFLYSWILRYLLSYDRQNFNSTMNSPNLNSIINYYETPRTMKLKFEIWNFDRAFQMCKHPFNNVAYYYVVVDTGINLFNPSSFIAKSILCCIILRL